MMKKAPAKLYPVRKATRLWDRVWHCGLPAINCDVCSPAGEQYWHKIFKATQQSLHGATFKSTSVINQPQRLRLCCGWSFELDFSTNGILNEGASINSPNRRGFRSRWQLFGRLLDLALGLLSFLKNLNFFNKKAPFKGLDHGKKNELPNSLRSLKSK